MKFRESQDTNIITKPDNFNYETFLDFKTQGDKFLLVTDSESFNTHRDDIHSKWKIATLCYLILLFMQVLTHSYLSYHTLKDCESRINYINENSIRGDSITRDASYICASYLMHVILIVGYFIIAFITTYKQTKLTFQIFEMYILIMFLSDLFFTFVNP